MIGVRGVLDFESDEYRYFVGFSNPFIGTFKCQVWAYKKSTDTLPDSYEALNGKLNHFRTEAADTHMVHGGLCKALKMPVACITFKK